MSTAKDGCLLLRVANPTTSHLTLKSQRPVGMVDLVDYVSGPISAGTPDFISPPATCSPPSDLMTADVCPESPEMVRAMSEFTYGSQLSEEELNELKSLMNRYTDCVSVHDYDIGRTSLLEHRIDTGDAPPQRRHPYRISLSEQKKVDELIGKSTLR